jgi:phage terminase large subunit
VARRSARKAGETPEPIPARTWEPRHYQADIARARAGLPVPSSVTCSGWTPEQGECARFLVIWHRRAGKDRTGLELIRDEAEKNVGSYWHLYPLAVQAKRAIWNGVDPGSKQRLLELVFPSAMVDYSNDTEMFKRFSNGSTYQLCGSDRYDSLVGSNVRGVLFSEWALCDPRAWPYIMPILAENGGWAAFITTYRGKNHAYQMAKDLMGRPDWYVDVRTIENTRRASGRPVVSASDVERERESLMAIYKRNATRVNALIREEFYCEPTASAAGAIYGQQVDVMRAEGRL